MTIDEAIDVFGQYANVIDYGVAQGIRKSDLVWLFDRIYLLSEDSKNVKLMKEAEGLIAIVAEQSFDEKINSILMEIKKTICELKGEKWIKNS